jgi:hypothetical protein
MSVPYDMNETMMDGGYVAAFLEGVSGAVCSMLTHEKYGLNSFNLNAGGPNQPPQLLALRLKLNSKLNSKPTS